MSRRILNRNFVPIIIIGMMFFVFGFATWINAMLIPYFKIACELSHFQSYLVTFAFYISYLVVSVPSSFLLKKIGFKKGMMIGFWVMAAGAFVFIPAAQTRTYGLFLCGLFLIGIGLSVLQTAANPYVTILGAKNRAAQRISIMGICNKTAGIIAPLLLAAAILRPGDNALFQSIQHMDTIEKNKVLDALIRRVIFPYACVGSLLTILGFAVRFSPLPEIENFKDEDAPVSNSLHRNIFSYPHLILGGCGDIFTCRLADSCHRQYHQLCTGNGNFYDGSQSIPFLHTFCNDMRIPAGDYPDSLAHLPGECVAVLYFTGRHTFPVGCNIHGK